VSLFSTCLSPKIECEDGSCIDSKDHCSMYNGCPLSNPIQCANGNCVSDAHKCSCEGNQTLCFDSSCVSSRIDCISVPSQTKVIQSSISVDVSDNVKVSLTSQEAANLGVLHINPIGKRNTDILRVIAMNSMADSEIAKVNHPSRKSGEYLSNVLSTVVSFNSVEAILELQVEFSNDKQSTNLCLASLKNNIWNCVSDVKRVNESSSFWEGTINSWGTYCIIYSSSEVSISSIQMPLLWISILQFVVFWIFT